MSAASINLGAVATIVAGQSPPGSSYNENGNGLPFFQGKAEFGEVYPKPVKWCTAPTKLAEAGDILISVRAPVGPTNISAEKCCIGRGLAAIRPDPDKADAGFVHWALIAARSALERKANGSTFAAINRKDLASLRIPLPPLDEQRRIVGLLDRTAEIKRRADAARAKARAIIPALFLDTFGDPATNPKGWPHLPFGQITSEFRYGTNQKCHDESGKGSVPVLRIPNVIGGQIDWSDIKHAALPAKEREKTRLRVGDLLFVRTNGNPDYIGRCAYFDAQTDASYASYLIRARLAESMSPIFAVHHFNHPRFRPLMLRMGKTTAGNYNLSVEGLSALPVMVPPLALQAAFADHASRIHSLARHLDAAAAKAEAMGSGLSADVFG